MATEIITTVLTPAASEGETISPYALTDLETVKDELTIPDTDTGNDAWLQRAINQASAAIMNYCKRVFQVEGVQDLAYIEQDAYPYQLPGGIFPLQLARWPLLPTNTVMTVKGDTQINSTLIQNVTSVESLLKGTPVSGSGIPAGAQIHDIDTDADTITLDQAATATNTQTDIATGMVVVENTQPGVPCRLVLDRDYKVDAEKGWLIRLNRFTGLAEKWPAMPVTVQYAAGYSTIPDDLVDAVLRQITGRYKGKGRDPMLRTMDQPGLGSQTFWIGTPPGQYGALPPEVRQMVDHYRVPSTA